MLCAEPLCMVCTLYLHFCPSLIIILVQKDDESDYFDMSKWLSPEERKFLKEKEEQLAKAREERKNKFTIDLKGRKVVAVDESVTDVEESIRQEIREVMARRPTEQGKSIILPQSYPLPLPRAPLDQTEHFLIRLWKGLDHSLYQQNQRHSHHYLVHMQL